MVKKLLSLLLLSFSILPIFGADTDTQPLRKVKYALQWADQAQFAGVYMAQKKGFFAREGLEVEFTSGEVKSSLVQLQAGEVDFAQSMLCSALEQADKGTDLVLALQIIQYSNLALIAWKDPLAANDTPILRPTDIGQRPVSIWAVDFGRPYEIFFRRNNLTPPTIVPQYNTISLFIRKGVYAYSGMTYNELNMARQRGISSSQLSVFPLRDFGVDFPEDGLYCKREFYRKDPQLVAKMARAVKAGWNYAKAHPDEALDEVMERVRITDRITNKPHMSWMLKTILPSIFPAESSVPFGVLSREAYKTAVRQMRDYCGMKNLPKYDDFARGEAYETLP